jgi:hypothetical protein
MKFTITFKDPDGVGNSLKRVLDDSVAGIADLEEREAAREIRADKLETFLKPWVEFSEYLTVEFDTEAGTATVRKNR